MKILPNTYIKPEPNNPVIDGLYLYKKRKEKKYRSLQLICVLQGCKGYNLYHFYRFKILENNKTLEIYEKTFNTSIRENRVKIHFSS